MATTFLSDNESVAIKADAQTLTGSWVDIGGIVDTRGLQRVILWLDLDVNNSQNVRLHVVGYQAVNATSGFDINYTGTAVAGVSPVDFGYYELTNDTDQKIMIPIDLCKAVPFCKFQVQAGTVGVSAGIINSLYATKG